MAIYNAAGTSRHNAIGVDSRIILAFCPLLDVDLAAANWLHSWRFIRRSVSSLAGRGGVRVRDDAAPTPTGRIAMRANGE